MLAAIRTTILSRRSCALTGSAMTSRSRRSSTRGPPGAPRMSVSGPVPQPADAGKTRSTVARATFTVHRAVRRGRRPSGIVKFRP